MCRIAITAWGQGLWWVAPGHQGSASYSQAPSICTGLVGNHKLWRRAGTHTLQANVHVAWGALPAHHSRWVLEGQRGRVMHSVSRYLHHAVVTVQRGRVVQSCRHVSFR